jgi:hypothetical protein
LTIASVLALEYKRVYGDFSDRTWRRIKGRLQIKDESDTKLLPVVSAYAELRKLNRFGTIRLSDVRRYAFIKQNLPKLRCTGEQLYESLERMKPKPSRATIYRWGTEIGCPMRKGKTYSERELQLWVEKVITQTSFRFKNGQIESNS